MSCKPPYKVVHCRYFDEYGRRINPGCSQGDRCRFIHPSDPNWHAMKTTDNRVKSNSSGGSRKLATKGRRKISGDSTSSPNTSNKVGPSKSRSPKQSAGNRRRLSPLVSQEDLFHRCKVEADVGQPLDHQHKFERPLPRDRTDPSSNASGRHILLDECNAENTSRYDRHRDGGNKEKRKTSVSFWEDPSSTGSRFQSNVADLESLRNVNEAIAIPPQAGPLDNDGLSFSHMKSSTLSAKKERAEKLTDLFRRLAHCSNNVVQDTAAEFRDGKKLEAYNEISSALSKISPVAKTVVAPTLANVVLNHALSSQRVEDGLKAIGNLWEEVFDVFVTEIACVIDTVLDDALARLKAECEGSVGGILASSSSSKKRKLIDATSGIVSYSVEPNEAQSRPRMRGFTDEGDQFAPSHNKEEREHKRRRMPLAPSQNVSVQPSGIEVDLNSSIGDIFQEMKMKIEMQAHSLDTLTKENHELKTTLQRQAIPLTPMHSSGISSSLQQSPFNTAGNRVCSLSYEQLGHLRSALRHSVPETQRKHGGYTK